MWASEKNKLKKLSAKREYPGGLIILFSMLAYFIVCFFHRSGVAFAGTVPTVTTSSGVITHGAIVSNNNTIGWLIECFPSHTLPDDPIVFFGKPGASHLHDFWGNASTNANSTYSTQEAGSNNSVADTYNGSTVTAGTSCDLSKFAPGAAGETASYWAPKLYANGQPVTPNTAAQLYYRAKPVFGTDFKPFPTDTRLIVGNHLATSIGTNDAIANQHLYWECQGNTTTHYPLPPTSCTSMLMNVIFPSCYDNGPIDHTGPRGTDNQHFAYPVNNACPAGFPQKVPELSEKFKYTVPALNMTLQVSADGMGLLPTYTEHADFWNTWNPASLQYLVDKCINAQLSCGTNPITPITPVVVPSTTVIPVPSLDPTPTSTVGSTLTQLEIALCPHGIHNCGDNVNPSGTGNNNPLHVKRSVTITVVDKNNATVQTVQGLVMYDTASGTFKGIIHLGTLAGGQYALSAKMDGYLNKQFPGLQTITQGQTNSLAPIFLVTGDINTDNQLDILDYNAIINCFGSKQTTASCTTAPSPTSFGSDISDEGQINGFDYNLFLREIAVQKGA